MKPLIYTLFPIGILCLTGHLLAPDAETGYRLMLAGQYFLTAYVAVIAITALSKSQGRESYRQVYPLLLLFLFAFALIWMGIEELSGGNRVSIRFSVIRLVVWCIGSLTLTAWSIGRVKKIRSRIGELPPGKVIIVNYPPSSAISWIWAVLTFRDRIGKMVYLDGFIHYVDKETGLPRIKAVDSSLLIGRVKVTGISPERFKASWAASDHKRWSWLWNCRRHIRHVLKNAE